MEQKFEFKQLEIKPEGNWVKRNLLTAQGKKTIITSIIGAIAGALYYHFTEAQYVVDSITQDYLRSALIGGFFGFFITNSPCARGRC